MPLVRIDIMEGRPPEKIRELQATETGDECPQSKGFFDKLKGAFGA